MKNLKQAANALVLLLLVAVTSGCGGSNAKKLEGQWNVETILTGSQLSGMSKYTEGMPPGARLSRVTMKGTANYHASGTMNHSIELMTMTVEAEGQAIELAFQGSMSGTWTLEGDTLTEVTTDIQMKPANELTTAIFAQADSAELENMFDDELDTSVATIKFLSDDVIEATEHETGITVTMRRAH